MPLAARLQRPVGVFQSPLPFRRSRPGFGVSVAEDETALEQPDQFRMEILQPECGLDMPGGSVLVREPSPSDAFLHARFFTWSGPFGSKRVAALHQ